MDTKSILEYALRELQKGSGNSFGTKERVKYMEKVIRESLRILYFAYHRNKSLSYIVEPLEEIKDSECEDFSHDGYYEIRYDVLTARINDAIRQLRNRLK